MHRLVLLLLFCFLSVTAFAQKNGTQPPLSNTKNQVLVGDKFLITDTLYFKGVLPLTTTISEGKCLLTSDSICVKDSTWNFYSKAGKLKTSLYYQDAKPVWQKEYYSKARLKKLVVFGEDVTNCDGVTYVYFKNGQLMLKSSFEKGFLHQEFYNRKGRFLYLQETFNNRVVLFPKSTPKDVAKQFNPVTETVYLQRNGKTKKLKAGTMVFYKLKTDSTLQAFSRVEGATENALILSSFSKDISIRKQYLRYDSTFTVNFSDIETIYFAGKGAEKRAKLSRVLKNSGLALVGVGCIVLPVSVVPVLTSIPLMYGSIILDVSSRHRKYDLAEWDVNTSKK